MPIILSRIDDRLIHGQVVIGWGRPLGLQRIVLVDDTVAGNDWEQDLYRVAVPDEIELVFSTVRGASDRLAEWSADSRRTAILTGDIHTMAQLVAADTDNLPRINVGGIHQRAGRTERLPWVYLSDEELAELHTMSQAGREITAQDVPTTAPISLEDLG